MARVFQQTARLSLDIFGAASPTAWRTAHQTCAPHSLQRLRRPVPVIRGLAAATVTQISAKADSSKRAACASRSRHTSLDRQLVTDRAREAWYHPSIA